MSNRIEEIPTIKGRKKLSSGLVGLDFQLDGGIPSGSLVLLCCGPLSGVEKLSFQFWDAESSSKSPYFMIDSAVREGMIDAGRYTPEEIVRDIGGERTVLDSLSTIIFRNGIEKTVGFLNSCSEKIRESEGNMLLIMYEGIHDAYEEILVKRNCDTIFTLSQSPHGNEVERFLQVNKIDGLNVPKRTYPYNILDKGIELSTTGRVV